jgi:microcystin-dependent protein
MTSAGSGNTPTWSAAFVSGMIMLWSGSVASVPTGWVLCNGSNSTPDLRDRFVVGAGSGYAVGATGGSANAIVVAHTHSINFNTSTASANHTHSIPGDGALCVNAGSTQGYDPGGFFGNIGLGSSTGANGADHVHGVSGNTDSTGSSATNANLPPYYALAYIMKT